MQSLTNISISNILLYDNSHELNWDIIRDLEKNKLYPFGLYY